jgi:mono/diheme cytochrome c family protein
VSRFVTEIPEHLLARSKARRQAIGQDGGDAPATDAPAAGAAVEKASSAAPAGPAALPGLSPAKAPAAPAVAPAPPPRPEVVAALTRKKMPWWATTACVTLVGWAFLFAFTLEPRETESPAIAEGRELYSPCSACHGADGGGGSGPAFADGAVIETFGAWEDQVEWVTIGSQDWQAATGSNTYGDNATPVGASGGIMPGFGTEHGGSYTEEEILLVVRFEREVIAEHGCEPTLAEETGEECAPGTEAEAATE